MSNIKVLDLNFMVVGVIDSYESFIWTDRFHSYGDFELYTPVSSELINLCQQNRYLISDFSVHAMIIESISIETSFDAGQKMKVTGRSLESLLDRRIVWNQTVINQGTSLQNAIKTLINASIISPTKTERAIPNFYFLETTNSDITALTVEKMEFTGDQINTIIDDLCNSFNSVGYRILFGYQMNYIHYYDPDFDFYNDYDFVFELYTGEDRGYEQFANPFVIFSPNYDNIINTNYIDSLESMKNVTLVLGEGEGSSRVRLIVGGQEGPEGNKHWIPGLYRREYYTDARDLQSSDYSSTQKYKEALKQRGLEKLYENSRITSYEGEVEATRLFMYGRDFTMGDLIQIENEYGIMGKARVVEWVRSESDSGIEAYPTFDGIQIIDDSEEDDEEVS